MIAGFTQKVDPRSWGSFVRRFNIAPTQTAPVIAYDPPQGVTFRWGLIPHWSKDEKIGYSMINARAETLLEKPAFRKLVGTRRCLVPADGFYEWKKEGKKKQPFYFRMRSRKPFAFAGLWDSWKKSETEEVHSFTIITTAPNVLTGTVHDRMPAILRREDLEKWLLEKDAGEAAGLLRPYEAGEMEAIAVSDLVNSPKNDSPACIEEVKEAAGEKKAEEVQGGLFPE